MTRLLALLLTLNLMASIAIPGDAVSRCEGMGLGISAVIGCCPAAVPVADQSCCCVELPAPAPAAALPSIDRHWLVGGMGVTLVGSVTTLWSYAPADAPAGIWRAPPVLAFGGAPPPRARSCIILT